MLLFSIEIKASRNSSMFASNTYLPISQVGPKGPPTLVEQFHEYKELTVSDIPSDTVYRLGQ